jgi:hypothetical protein
MQTGKCLKQHSKKEYENNMQIFLDYQQQNKGKN